MGLSISQLYRVWEMDKEIKQSDSFLSLVREQNNNSRNQSDYFSSELYKNSLAKNQNFKVKDEEVLDTSPIEPVTDTKDVNFIPKKNSLRTHNIELWWEYFFSPDRDNIEQ